ncbi:MAG: sensor histidine kinase, partial [Tepidimonas sp.]|uniref:sensor histidine kinase n=1 Tax=Tepidimonas sp. TaxID=2002775 RepID=UPI0040551A72
LLQDRGARLALELPAAPLFVRADADRLQQVLINLLSNAAKFVPADGGQVRLRVAPSVAQDGTPQATVEVQDNGPGVPPAEQAVIFEKFRQGSNAQDRPGGTGLGLPISRRIVEHFGGRLWLRSLPGQGACFGFDLPLLPRAWGEGTQTDDRGPPHEQARVDRGR